MQSLLVDGGFLTKKLKKPDPNPEVQAHRLIQAARACLDARVEELYRIFYYDCPPYGCKQNDLLGNEVDFGASPHFAYQTALLSHIAKQPFVAVRRGTISYQGWVLKTHLVYQMRRKPQSVFGVTDFAPKFAQKGVDMRIGLDVAMLAIDKKIDRVALVTADSDFIPAMKLARREGLQVVLSSLSGRTKPELLDHADIYRNPDLSAI